MKYDFAFSFRVLARKPGFTLIVLLTLALGIGSNAAVFAVVNTILLRSLPYPDSGKLVQLYEVAADLPQPWLFCSIPNYLDWKERSRAFEHIAAYRPHRFVWTGGSQPERLGGARVSSDMFALLGFQPAAGRLFNSADERPGNDQVVVLAYEFWQARFGGQPDAIGESLILDGSYREVVGVLPPAKGPLFKSMSLFVPWVAIQDPNYPYRFGRDLTVYARIRANASWAQAASELDTISKALQLQYPDSNKGWTARLIPLHEITVGSSKATLLLLTSAVAFILLISCANVANLLLARSSQREDEISVRVAVGATRGRLMRQFLIETGVLFMIGGAIGLLLSYWGVRLLVSLGPAEIPRLDEVSLDLTVILVTLGATLVTGLVFGSLPAWVVTSPHRHKNVNAALGSMRGSAGNPSGTRLTNSLVVAEVALALVLLIGAGLMIQSFVKLRQVDPGFAYEDFLTLQIVIPENRYPQNQQRLPFFRTVKDHLDSIPGVQETAYAATLPLGGGFSMTTVSLKNPRTQEWGPERPADVVAVDSGYLQLLGIALQKGRHFDDRDNGQGRPVAIIDENVARLFWPEQEALGQEIEMYGAVRHVVGVVSAVKYSSLDAGWRPKIYFPYSQAPEQITRSLFFLLRTAIEPSALTQPIKDRIWQLDPDLPISGIRTIEDYFEFWLEKPGLNILLFAVPAGLATLLAMVGAYGVAANTVGNRKREIGIRMALGARHLDIVRLVMRQGVLLTALGVGSGSAAAFGLTRFLESRLYDVSPTDPVTFASVALLMAAVALLACLIPNLRAARTDPLMVLHHE